MRAKVRRFDARHDIRDGHAFGVCCRRPERGEEARRVCAGEGPSPSAFMNNLKAPMPIGRKLELIARNTWIKVRLHQQCCGHPGEPGC